MNKSFVLSVIMLIGINCSAQNTTKSIDWEWAPIGAVWYYETSNMFGGNYDIWSHYWYVRSAKDTVFQGVNCRKLEVVKFSNPTYEPEKKPSRYTYQDGGDIYFYNTDIGEFVLSFSYDIQNGDTVEWQMPDGLNCSNSYWLDSVFNWDAGYLNGSETPYSPNSIFMYCNTEIKSYKVLYEQNTCFSNYIGVRDDIADIYGHGQYYEYCGSVMDIFDLTLVEELSAYLVCYCDENTIINKAALYNENDTIIFAEDSCLNYYNQFTNSILSEPEKGLMRIYPNPVTNNLHINLSETGSYSIEIISLEGKSLFYKTGFYGIAKIELGYLSHGIYIVSVKTKSKIYTKKIIKM
jgi:hypothetical protein